jgi:thiamine biosynthesis lipoprotein
LANGAVATSGDYEIYYDEERVFHHVVDPRTGRSPTHSTSVSVVAESAMRADALSTSVFVMDPAAGMRLIDSLPATECLLIDHEGVERRTHNWSAFSARESV